MFSHGWYLEERRDKPCTEYQYLGISEVIKKPAEAGFLLFYLLEIILDSDSYFPQRRTSFYRTIVGLNEVFINELPSIIQ